MLKENYRLALQTVSQVTANAPVLWRETAQDDHTPTSSVVRRKSVAASHPTLRSHVTVYSRPAEASDALRTPIRVLLIDPSVIVCAGLRAMLAEEHEMVIVGETGQSAEALWLAHRLQPNVILIDLMTPEQEGVELIRRLHQALPACNIVVLTHFSEQQQVYAALQAGAIGYLLKDVVQPDLLRAIQAAARGEPTLHPVAQRALMRKATSALFQGLTERELGVLRLIGQGCSNRTIAETLCLTEGTVKGYVSTILAKLQVDDRTQAALYAVKHGLNYG
jgi:NarL family two-component system response regulator LiaR